MAVTLHHAGWYEPPHGPDGFVLDGCTVSYRAEVDGDTGGRVRVAGVTVRVVDGTGADHWVEPPDWIFAGLLAHAQRQAETDPCVREAIAEALESQAREYHAGERSAAE